jgi:hypothetical protein
MEDKGGMNLLELLSVKGLKGAKGQKGKEGSCDETGRCQGSGCEKKSHCWGLLRTGGHQ